MARKKATPENPTWQHYRGKVAGISSRPERSADDPELLDARQNFHALRLREYIEQTLSSAPPLSDEQRAALAELLAPIRSGGLA